MAEILFYQLGEQTLEVVLPALLERSLGRGWRVCVQAGSDERADALDAHLWTYRDDSFLPHGTDRDTEAAAHPIVLCTSPSNTNGAAVRILTDGVDLPSDLAPYERVVVVFDGGDESALHRARMQWTEAKQSGAPVTYYLQDEAGRWVRRA